MRCGEVSNVEGSKLRIWKIYQLQPDRKLRAKALANEYAPYGPGGSSHTYLDGSSGWLDHDSKGLTFEHYPDHQKVLLRWDRVEKYIDLMIQSNRYLSDKERRAIDFPLELNAASAAEYTALKAQHPDTLVGFEAGGNFMFYGEDAAKVADAATARYHELGDSIKAAETRMAEIAVLRTHIVNYARTRPVYDAYRKAGYSKRFLDTHREEITLHKAAKTAFDEAGLKKLPKAKDLSIEYAELLKRRKSIPGLS